ncbi:hypothetical protein D3C75_864160 [compost metagenome]
MIVKSEYLRSKAHTLICTGSLQQLSSQPPEVLRLMFRSIYGIQQRLVAWEKHPVIRQDHPPAVEHQIAGGVSKQIGVIPFGRLFGKIESVQEDLGTKIPQIAIPVLFRIDRNPGDQFTQLRDSGEQNLRTGKSIPRRLIAPLGRELQKPEVDDFYIGVSAFICADFTVHIGQSIVPAIFFIGLIS